MSRSINHSINHAIHQLISHSIRQSVNRSVNQSTNQSITHSIQQSINRPLNQSINQSDGRPAPPNAMCRRWCHSYLTRDPIPERCARIIGLVAAFLTRCSHISPRRTCDHFSPAPCVAVARLIFIIQFRSHLGLFFFCSVILALSTRRVVTRITIPPCWHSNLSGRWQTQGWVTRAESPQTFRRSRSSR